MSIGALPPVIRPARPSEAAALTALCISSKAHWGYDAAFLAACAGELIVTQQMIADDRVRVAELDGTRAGVVAWEEIREIADQPSNVTVEITLLFVAPPALRSGIGTALFDVAREIAFSSGATQLLAIADPFAAGFYAARGMSHIGDASSEIFPARSLPRYAMPLGH